MALAWLCLLAFMLAGYGVLDGYDIGAGMAHLFVARTDEERAQVIASIGPLWDGNEVWLVALGGSLFFAFPVLYAVAFSGFYLELVMVLWLLVFRGLSIELREQFESRVWRPFWDATFAAASVVLGFVFGVAAGNVIRGVPLDGKGGFFLALWTDFSPRPPVGIFDWYTVAVGVLTAATLFLHGLLWLVFRTPDPVSARARALAWPAFAGVWLAIAVVAALTPLVQPQTLVNLGRYPWGGGLAALALGALVATGWLLHRGRARAAFACSSAFIVTMLVNAAFAIFPYVLPSSADPNAGLTVWNAAGGHTGLGVGLRWWLPGMAIAVGYTVYVHWKFSGRVGVRPTH
jgi:cytochrome bd ubiquinol oxidase subunit II